MLAISKSKDLKQLMTKIFGRLQHMKEVKTQFLEFIIEVQELYSSFSQKIHKQMVGFEDKIVHNTLYSNNKIDEIINMAKIYQEFSLQLEKNAKISLISLEKINDKEIVSKEQELNKKSKQLLKEFEEYLKSQKEYDEYFGVYRNKCTNLDQAMDKYSNKDPIFFYNQASSAKEIKQIESKYNDCTNFQTSVINQTQRLDLTRKELSQHIKEISDCYVSILHIYLVMIQKIITSVVDCKKEESTLKKLGLRKSSMNAWGNPSLELQQLDSLFSQYNQNSPRHSKPKNQLLQDFSVLFDNQINLNPSSNSDAKLFFDRCDTMRKKKLKTVNEVIKIQKLLIQQLESQSQNCDTFQKGYKTIEKDIFTNNGIESYKKRFRKYFGSNFMEMEELCLAVMQRQKKSFEKINRSMQSIKIKFKQLIHNKEQSIKLFEKRSKLILEEHLKLKQKIEKQKSTPQGDKLFKDNIAQCFKQLKQSFIELQSKQSQIDKQFFSALKNHNEAALKFEMNKSLIRVLERQKNRLSILASLDINSQIVLILKEDNRYDMLLNQCPKPNLYETFTSLADKDKYDETKSRLKKKQNRLNETMLSKKGCFGSIILSPKKSTILSQHQCYLIYDPKSKNSDVQKLKGYLKISSASIIFQQKVFLSLFDGLNLTIPESDIEFFQASNNVNFKQGVEIRTQYGILLFESKQFNEIIQSIQKNINFRPKDLTQSRLKKSDSNSFLKNNTSTQYRVSFDKNATNAEGGQASPMPTNKSKPKPYETLMKQFLIKWQDEELFNNSFVKVAIKSNARRDYTYQSTYSKLFVKELKQYEIKDKDIILTYLWKISFPDSPMLHSFKHTQTIFIESINKQMTIRIVKGMYCEEQLFIKNKFYQEIDQMNQKLTNFIAKSFEKQAKVVLEFDQNCKTIDSFKIALEEIILTQKQPKLQKNEGSLRNSLVQRRRSNLFNGFKTL